ncbi:MAG: SPOR domain-containing protein [Burkholderiales bacterium]|nr:SPOR domain-containing protein [Burkholderiales bacterium]
MGKFLIGLILGVGIAIGVVYYLNNSQTQLVNKFNNVQENSVNDQPALLSPSTKMKEVSGTKSNGNNDGMVDESEYDFYQILQNKNDSSTPTASKVNKKVATNYVVQVGSFADIAVAKDMKARLAFLGYEAKIFNLQKGTGTINQILIGPYASEAEAKATQEDLSSNGIKTTVMKPN